MCWGPVSQPLTFSTRRYNFAFSQTIYLFPKVYFTNRGTNLPVLGSGRCLQSIAQLRSLISPNTFTSHTQMTCSSKPQTRMFISSFALSQSVSYITNYRPNCRNFIWHHQPTNMSAYKYFMIIVNWEFV